MKSLTRILALIFISLVLLCCKKEGFINSKDAQIALSADTLHFDTVFTSTGSITQKFKIFNTNNQKLKLDRVKLMGGPSSPFRINVDGASTDEATDLEIAANDSMYVFVSVTINPNNTSLPFVVQDSILVSFNSNEEFLQLEAYGQNAHFLRSRIISADTSFANDLPYVILGGLLVDSNVTLTLGAGCRIYSHANAPIIVDGTLIANGTLSDSINFRGDRLDRDYRDLPAGWPGIYFRGSSKSSVFTHVNVLNAYQALVVDLPSSNGLPKLTLNECKIDNAYDAGILCLNSSLKAVNCLVSNCGVNILLANGGNYEIDQCTVAAYSNIYLTHKQPAVALSNWDSADNQLFTYPLAANFQNCIIWGDYGTVEDEVFVTRKGTDPFTVNFNHVLYKATTVPADVNFTNSLMNMDPMFDSIGVGTRYFDFHLNTKPSPAVDAGFDFGINTDLDGKTRVPPPDLGCYEKQ